MQTLTLAVNPQSANIHQADRLQYISCATWAIRDIVADLDRRTHNHRLLIGSRFPLGSGQQTGQIISLYALSNRNIIVKGFDMTLPSYPATLGHYSSVMPTYVIFYKEWAKTMGVPGTRLKLIKELPSAYDNRCSTVQLYKVV